LVQVSYFLFKINWLGIFRDYLQNRKPHFKSAKGSNLSGSTVGSVR